MASLKCHTLLDQDSLFHLRLVLLWRDLLAEHDLCSALF